MKRFFALFIAFILLLSCVSCSNGLAGNETAETLTFEESGDKKETEEKEKEPIVIPEGFSAGFARVVVNPDPGTGLGGYGNVNDRLSKAILDDIMLTCTALSDGENTVFIFSSDTIHVAYPIAAKVAAIAEKEFGVPQDHVFMNATHSHASPALYNSTYAGMAKYVKKYYVAAEKIMEEALRDLAPATLYTGSGETENLNYVRRYVSLDGKTYIGGSAINDDQDPAKVRHETDADTELQVLKFDRGEKKDIVMVNWQCHTTTTGSANGTGVSADWVKGLRDKVEKDGEVHFSFHQGAAGNVVPNSKIKGELDNGDHIKHGEKIADVVLQVMENLTKREAGKIQAKMLTLKYDLNEKYIKDQKISSYTQETVHHYVFAIGDVAFATFPGELHDTLGMEVKEKSPFEMTFVCAYTNGTAGYLPAEYAWANGGYEVESTHFVKGTPENMVKEVLAVLGEFHTAQ